MSSTSTKRSRSRSRSPPGDAEAETKRPRTAPTTRPTSTTSVSAQEETLCVSPAIKDRQSTFMAYYHPTLSPRNLLSLIAPQTKTADHRIQAWRHPRKPIAGTTPAYDTGCSDDGEKHAGKRALDVLVGTNITGSLVVARWWGGVMLGPARFEHIASCARGAIEIFLERKREAERVVVEARRAVEVRAELVQRDASIAALRGLVEEKSRVGLGGGRLKEAGHAGESPGVAQVVNQTGKSPTKKVDYDSLDLDRLVKLGKARDGTIAFLLKKLDELDAVAAKRKQNDT